MPYAIACPRCQTIIVLETLGPFDCPTCSSAPTLPASPLPLDPPRAWPDSPPPPLEVDWPTVTSALSPPTREPMPPEPLGIDKAIVTPAPPRREMPVALREHDSRVGDEEPVEEDGDEEYDSEALQRRRAFLKRERVARRKLLTKLAVVAVLAFVTLFMVRAAINHVNAVAEHNATILNER